MPGTYEERRQRILDRLARHGMHGFQFTHLGYLNTANEHFRSARECAQRMMILWAVSIAAEEAELRDDTVVWLRRVGLWEHTSAKEKELLFGKVKDERHLMDFSWGAVGSLILAWALDLIPGELVMTEVTCSPEQLDAFKRNVPLRGMEVDGFLNEVRLRDLEEILDENIFNELVTSYLRDHLGDPAVHLIDLDINVSFKRHEALNWLRRFDA